MASDNGKYASKILNESKTKTKKGKPKHKWTKELKK